MKKSGEVKGETKRERDGGMGGDGERDWLIPEAT